MASWSIGEIEKLRELMTRGLTFSKIADILGRTRNACIGRSHRLDEIKLVRPTKHVVVKLPPVKKVKLAKPKKPAKPKKLKIVAVAPQPQRKTERVYLLELEHNQCRYPVAEDNDGQHLFCGKVKEETGAYCTKHRDIAYVKSRYSA
jgi:hypothetical protein